jgi:hypothetical protein
MPDAGTALFVITLGLIINFSLAVMIARWIFRVNKIVNLLEEISGKINDLPKKPIEWNEIMPPK